jgi:hypothetical protein
MIKGPDQVKMLCAGAVVALAAGLLAGAAMKPDLAGDDQPAGPQSLADPGPRAAAPLDDPVTYASYPARYGRTPDYVQGTDWKKMTAPAAEPSRDRADIVRLEDILRSPPDDDVPAAQDASRARTALPAFAASDAYDDAYDDASRAEKTPAGQGSEPDGAARADGAADSGRAP